MQHRMASQAISTSADEVWTALLDSARLVADVTDILTLNVAQEGKDARTACWRVWLKGFELEWQEQQQCLHRERRLQFRQSQGMFAAYEGEWGVRPAEGGAVLEFELRFGSGMPHLGDFIDPVLADAFMALSRSIMDAIMRRSSNSSASSN